jgi:hypothetical protein
VNRAAIASRVHMIVALTLHVQAPITGKEHLVDDLGATWVHYNAIASEIERAFARPIRQLDLEYFSRVRDITRWVAGRVAA